MTQAAFANLDLDLRFASERAPDVDLRTAAALSCDRSEDFIPLATVWQRLVDGRLRVVDEFSSERRCYALLEMPKRPGRIPSGLNRRGVEVLGRVLTGELQKAIALELGTAPSTIASSAANCLMAMGFRCSASRAPVLLVKVFHAHRDERCGELATSTVFRCGEASYRVIGTQRPDRHLPGVLSEAERSVVRLLLEGRSNREIAECRHTSIHTTAKQVASAFRKLDVNGRLALLWRLVSTSSRA
jgi:DNA-binding NarL/FixJ family response regulator